MCIFELDQRCDLYDGSIQDKTTSSEETTPTDGTPPTQEESPTEEEPEILELPEAADTSTAASKDEGTCTCDEHHACTLPAVG